MTEAQLSKWDGRRVVARVIKHSNKVMALTSTLVHGTVGHVNMCGKTDWHIETATGFMHIEPEEVVEVIE